MDEDTRKQLIQTAKAALRITHDFTSVAESIFLLIQERYLTWNDAGWFGEGDLPGILIERKKATKNYLKATKGPPIPIPGREALEQDLRELESMEWIIKDWENVLRQKGDELSLRDLEDLGPKKGRRPTRKLHTYIWQMAGWYSEFFDKPAYGTDSIFTRLVGDCLAVIDDKYKDTPPYKAIKSVILETRKRFPYGLPPASG